MSSTAAALESAKFEHSVLEEDKLAALARVEAIEAELRAYMQSSAHLSAQSAVAASSSMARDELFDLRSRIELLDQELVASAQRDGEGVSVNRLANLLYHATSCASSARLRCICAVEEVC